MFFLIFQIFKNFIDSKLSIIDPEWEKDIKEFKQTSNERLKKFIHIIEDNKNQLE